MYNISSCGRDKTYSVPPLLSELELGLFLVWNLAWDLGCGWRMLGGSTLFNITGKSFAGKSCMWGRGSNGLNRAPTLHCGGETDGDMLKVFRGSRQNIVGPRPDSSSSASASDPGQNIHYLAIMLVCVHWIVRVVFIRVWKTCSFRYAKL